MNKRIIAIILIDVLLALILAYITLYSKHSWEGPPEKRFTVGQGESLSDIAEDLHSQDVITSRTLFKIIVMISGKQDEIIAGTYLMKSGLSNLDVLDYITGKSGFVMVKYTLPPGSTLRKAAVIAEKTLSHSPVRFMEEAANDSLINLLNLKGKIKNLEGFLYPETYEVSPGITEKELVAILFSEFVKKVLKNEEIISEVRKKETDLLKTVTLASIIEAETNIEEEKKIIAGVYLNRLSKGMKLEADPTVQYALPGGPKKRLLYEDLRINSPYNTYIYTGLPPGPINNPDVSCIKAALFPEIHSYLFFVATGDGGHKFTENYAEHMKAVQEYRNNLKKK